MQMLSGSTLTYVGAAGAAVLVALGLVRKRWAGGLVVLALSATAAVPWGRAFLDGHPFRIRATWCRSSPATRCGGRYRRRAARLEEARVLAALVYLALVGYELRPLDMGAPMVVEAQWDRPNVPARAAVTACLGPLLQAATIMASMGSLGALHAGSRRQRVGSASGTFYTKATGTSGWRPWPNGPRVYAGSGCCD